MYPVDTNVVVGLLRVIILLTNLEMTKPNNLNAFDIISLSIGFDLSGLFVTNDRKEEVQFTSKNTFTAIVLKNL